MIKPGIEGTRKKNDPQSRGSGNDLATVVIAFFPIRTGDKRKERQLNIWRPVGVGGSPEKKRKVEVNKLKGKNLSVCFKNIYGCVRQRQEKA